MIKSTIINLSEEGGWLKRLMRFITWNRTLGAIVAVSAFITLSMGVYSRFAPVIADDSAGATVTASVTMADTFLTLTVGGAGDDAACVPTGGNVNISAMGDDRTYMACMNVFVDTNSGLGYSLTMAAASDSLTGNPSGTIHPTSGTIGSPTALNSNAWGFCIPGNRMTNVANGFAGNCVGANGVVTSGITFARMPTTATLIRQVNGPVTTAELQNTPIRFGARPTVMTPAGVYSTSVTITASLNMAPPRLMQTFTASECSSMNVGDIALLLDNRDGREYRVQRMADGQCWMIDNLAYIGGGSNVFGDAVPVGITATPSSTATSTAGTLNMFAGNAGGIGVTGTDLTTWDRSNARRWITINTNPNVLIDPVGSDASGPWGGVRCDTNNATLDPNFVPNQGNTRMQSVCGGQVLYNFCAALGLDDTTTPTCADVSNTTTGAGMTAAGVVGATGGVGGESRGSGGSSICPTGWRVPVGRVGAADNTRNEWGLLQGAWLGTPGTVDVTNTAITQAFWQANTPTSMFGTVASGWFSPGFGLHRQSQEARWWASSLQSATNGSNTWVNGTWVTPGVSSNSKHFGFAVRCVFP